MASTDLTVKISGVPVTTDDGHSALLVSATTSSGRLLSVQVIDTDEDDA